MVTVIAGRPGHPTCAATFLQLCDQPFTMESDRDRSTSAAVVVDIGSRTTRAGFGGQQEPCFSMLTVVGRFRNKQPPGEEFPGPVKDVYVGDEIEPIRSALTVKYTMDYGVVTNFDDLEILLSYLFNEKLHANMTSTPFLMVDGESMCGKYHSEKMTQIAFETFNVPYFYLAPSSSLILASANRTTGLSVDLSERVCRVIPVYEGYFLRNCVRKYYGVDSQLLTDQLCRLLTQNNPGMSFVSRSYYDAARDIKEKFAYFAQDCTQEKETFNASQQKQYELPDGKTITVGTERFECAEPLFEPPLAGVEMPGLAEHIVNTVGICDVDIRQDLLGNVVLAGGGSLVPGLASRLQQEVQKELRQSRQECNLREMHVQVLAPSNGDLLAWKGASRLASRSGFTDLCISSDEYDEYGPSLVHQKCF